MILLCLAVVSGCDINRDVSTENNSTFEDSRISLIYSAKPIFHGLNDIRTDKELPDLYISENSKGTVITVRNEEDKIADTSRYLRLKDRILRSAQWSDRVPSSSLSIVFTGPPRDRLDFYMGNEAIRIVDSSIPESWKRELKRLVKEARYGSISESQK